jgi:imidazoleglycerol phosphate synthase glutamine amidotransferase subunit HisH
VSAPRVTLFDYGAGNLHSLAKALEAAGAAVRVEPDAARAVADTDAVILPGVGRTRSSPRPGSASPTTPTASSAGRARATRR